MRSLRKEIFIIVGEGLCALPPKKRKIISIYRRGDHWSSVFDFGYYRFPRCAWNDIVGDGGAGVRWTPLLEVSTERGGSRDPRRPVLQFRLVAVTKELVGKPNLLYGEGFAV